MGVNFMQIVISTILTVFFLLVLPCIIGCSFERYFVKVDSCQVINIPRCLVMGFAIMLASFQLVAVPMIAIGTTFHTLLYVWIFVLTVYAIITVYLNYSYVRDNIKFTLLKVRDYYCQTDRQHIVILCLAILLIIFETCLLIFRTHMDTDDARFIAEALDAYEKNSLLRIHPITGTHLDFPIGEMIKDLSSPYPIFIAAMSALTRIHPAVLSHAVFPVLLIPISYIVSYLISDFLIADKKQVPTFMFILASIVLFSFESLYSWGYTMLTIIWQGRSIVAVIMLPFLWYVLMNILKSSNIVVGLYFALFIISLACVDLSGMGGIMAPIVGAVFALSFLMIRKQLIPSICIGLATTPVGIYEILYRILRPSTHKASSSNRSITEIIINTIKNIIGAHKPYAGVGMMMALYFVALMIIFFYFKDKVLRNIIIVPTIVMLCILYIGLPSYLAVGGKYDDFMVGRTFWILITPIFTSFAFTLFVSKIDKYSARYCALALMLPLSMYCGNFKLSNDMFINPENAYRLPQSTVDITEHVLSENHSPKLLVPYTIAYPFRQISSDVNLLYGEDATYGRIKTTSPELIAVSDQMVLNTPDLNFIIPLAKKNMVDYIVFDITYTELCPDGNINIYNYPDDENYVADRTATIGYDELKDITVIETDNDMYWDLSAYGLEYDGIYGQYVLYRIL